MASLLDALRLFETAGLISMLRDAAAVRIAERRMTGARVTFADQQAAAKRQAAVGKGQPEEDGGARTAGGRPYTLPARIKNLAWEDKRLAKQDGSGIRMAGVAGLAVHPKIPALQDRAVLDGRGHLSFPPRDVSTSAANTMIGGGAIKTVKRAAYAEQSLAPSRVARQTAASVFRALNHPFLQIESSSQRPAYAGREHLPFITALPRREAVAGGEARAVAASHPADYALPLGAAREMQMVRPHSAAVREPIDYEEIVHHIERRLSEAIACSAEGA
ncbi:MAG: hypothetical protein LBI19_09440 [Oscillospiraceae bacterium]|nr:hypothetical protein [Oscillospiraceae bacterium]